MTTRVDVEKENFETILFPDICPVCGKESPDSQTKIRTYFATMQPLKEKIGYDWGLVIPVCEKHKKHISLGRIISAALFFGLFIVATLLMYILWNLFGDQGTLINVIVVIMVIGGMVYAHGKLYSAPLLIESFSYRLLFTFKIDELAIKFARLNNIDKVSDIMNQDRSLPEEKKT